MAQDPWRPPNHDPKRRDRGPWRDDYSEYTGYTDDAGKPRFLRMFLFLIGIALLMYFLFSIFPFNSDNAGYLIRGLILVVIIGGLAAFTSRSSTARLFKMAGIWGLIIAGISGFYIIKNDVGSQYMSAVDPTGVIEHENGLIVRRSPDGHFWLRAEINDTPIRMMVDTGASNIVLSPEDAERIGYDLDDLDFSRFADTANGRVSYASVRARSLELGPANFRNIPMTVNGAEMRGSLLGLSLLNEFSSVEFRGDTMIIRP